MNRRVWLIAAGVTASAALAALFWLNSRPPPDTQPYAGWRNGVIVHVRNCEPPVDNAARLRCAALYCAQQVSRRLTNAQQTKLRIVRYAREAAGGRYLIEGSLTQYLETDTLPNGFTCSMDRYDRAEPQFLFAGRMRNHTE